MTMLKDKGMRIVPVSEMGKVIKSDKTIWAVERVYCTNGHLLMDKEHPIHGYPGIRLSFQNPHGEGEIVISALAGDLTKITLDGELEPGASHELSCPKCRAVLPVLMPCGCKRKGSLVVMGLTPKLNFNNAITLCDVAGCTNASLVSCGEIIRHKRGIKI